MRAFLASLTCWPLCACIFQAGVVDDVQITCAGDAECPPEYVCGPRLGRCVPAERAGDPAPDFDGPPSVTPSVGKAGTTFVATFRLDAVPALPPTVLFGADDGAHAFADDGSTSLEQRFVYTASGDEPEGIFRVVTDLVGPSGDGVTREVGAIELDFTPPSLLPAATIISPAAAALGTHVFVRAAFDELIADGIVLRAGTAVLTPLDNTGGLLTFDVIASGDGTVPLTLEGIVDVAGNPALDIELGSFTLDGVPPVVTVAVDAPRYSENAGFDGVVAFVTASDDRSDAVDVEVFASFAGRQMDCTAAPIVCTTTVAPTDPEGLVAVEVTARDVAGNVSLAQAITFVDRTPPDVVTGTDSVRITPPPGSLVADPVAAASGASVFVSFFVDEAIDPTTLALDMGGSAATLVAEESGFVAFRLDVTDVAPSEDGPQEMALVVSDVVGNAGVVDVGESIVGVDRASPALADSVGKLTLIRRPFGDTTTTEPALKLRVDPAGLESGATLRVLNRPSPPFVELARTPLASGVFDVDLDPQDRVEVFAQLVDIAGNASAPIRVRDGRYVAGLTPSAPDALFQHSSRVRATPAFFGRLLDENNGVGIGVAEASTGVADGVVRLAEGGPAVVHSFTEPPQILGYHAGYGGLFGFGFSELTLFSFWDGVATRPAVVEDILSLLILLEFGNAAIGGAIDEARGVVVLAGGCDFECSVKEIQGTRIISRPSTIGSHVRAGMTWDPDRERVLLFGGCASDDDPLTCVDPTLYAWDGDAWTVVTTVDVGALGGSVAPAALAYDRARQRVFIMANDVDVVALEVDAAGGTHVVALTPGPGARTGAGVAWDGARQRVVVAGGVDPFGVASDDAWGFDGSGWTALPTAGFPTGVSEGSLGFDPARDTLVLGGHGDIEFGTWELPAGATSWQAGRTSGYDGDQQIGHVVADPAGGSVVGVGFAGTYRFDDRWTDIGVPPPTDVQALVADNARILAVGADGAVLRFTGGSWTSLRTGAFPPRSSPQVAYDGGRRRVVLFGGQSQLDGTALAETWQLDVDTLAWTEVAGLEPGTDAPTARTEGQAAFDPISRRVVLVGGIDPNTGNAAADAAWAFDGVAWERLEGASPTQDAVLALDPIAGRLVTAPSADEFAFFSGGGAELSHFDGVRFVRSGVVAAFIAGFSGATVGDEIILAGGTTTATEVIEVGGAARPAVLVDFDVAAARLPAGTILGGFSLNIVAGATGSNVHGVTVQAFADGGFVTLGQSAATLANPTPLQVSSSTSAAALFANALHVAVVARGGSSTGDVAGVALDAAALTLDYRLP